MTKVPEWKQIAIMVIRRAKTYEQLEKHQRWYEQHADIIEEIDYRRYELRGHGPVPTRRYPKIILPWEK